MKYFDLDAQFKIYLELMNLDFEKLPLDQLTETKRAFIGGVSQFFSFIETGHKELSHEEGTKMLMDLQRQLREYWTIQSITH